MGKNHKGMTGNVERGYFEYITNSFEVVLTWEFEVLAILMEGRKKFPPFERGMQKVLPCLEGGPQNLLDLHFSHVVAPFAVINDQSLKAWVGCPGGGVTASLKLATDCQTTVLVFQGCSPFL